MHLSATIRGLICAFLGGFCWGFSGACGQFLFMRYGLDPLWLSAVRMVCAGLLLLSVCCVVPRWIANARAIFTNKHDVIHLIIFALGGLATCQVAYLMAINYSNAGTATVLQYIGPVLIVVFVCLKKLCLPKVREVVALICVLIGTFLIATHGDIGTMVLSEEGLFWGLMAALAVSLYTMLPMGLMDKYGSMPVTAVALLIGGVALSILVRPWTYDVNLDLVGYIGVATMIIVGTAIGFALYLQGVADIGAAKGSLVASVETVSATVFAVVWLGTAFSWIDFVGFFFIMVTVLLLMERPKKKPLPLETSSDIS